MRERDEETGQVWTYPEGGSTDFEDGFTSADEAAGGLRGTGSPSGSEGGSSASRRRRGRRQFETQPFPEQALNAARLGAAMQAAEEAGLPLPAALRSSSTSSSSSMASSRAAGSGSRAGTSSSSSSSAAEPGSSSSNSGGGSKKAAAAAAVHIYPFGVDGAALVDIAESLGVRSRLALAEKVQDADAVLALRAKIKTGEPTGICLLGGAACRLSL